MLKSSLFYTKVSMKSIYFLVAMLVTSLDVFTRLVGILDTSIFLYTKYFLIPFIFFHIYLIISSSSMMYQEFKVLSFLEKEKGKKMIAIVIANTFTTIIFGLFSITIMFLFKNPLFNSFTVLTGFGHFFIVLLTGSLLAISIGIGIGALIKSELSIIVALAIYGLLLGSTFGSSSENLLLNYLRVFLPDDTFVIFNDIAGVLFTSDYFADKFVVIFVSILLLSITYFRLARIKQKRYIITPVLSMVALCYLIFYGINYEYDFYYEDEFDKTTIEEYKIASYKMQLDLQHKLKNKVQIKLAFNENSDSLSFLLEPIFEIDKILIDGQPSNYTFQNNQLVIQGHFIKNSTVNVEIQYSGKVHMKSDIGYDLFYVSPYAINLPGDTLFWYPSSLTDSLVNFEVNITSASTVYSNLQLSDGRLQGTENYASIFSGMYNEQINEGVRYIAPFTMSTESIEDDITTIIQEHHATISDEDLKTLKNKTYDQVIVVNWPVGKDLIKVENSTLYLRLQ